MQIIPVIDLMHGQVVHAKRGQRGQYLPLNSCLCQGSQPRDVLEGLLKLHPFNTIYIADIDAILGRSNHDIIIETLSRDYPHISFWLDAGINAANEKAIWQPNLRPVMGTESIHSLFDYQQINAAYNGRQLLSLDFDAEHAMGSVELHTQAALWPDDVICMTLNAVGAQNGVDLPRLHQLIMLNRMRTYPVRLYAAGGIRNVNDIRQLYQLDIAGVLIATALHQGDISASELKELSSQ